MHAWMRRNRCRCAERWTCGCSMPPVPICSCTSCRRELVGWASTRRRQTRWSSTIVTGTRRWVDGRWCGAFATATICALMWIISGHAHLYESKSKIYVCKRVIFGCMHRPTSFMQNVPNQTKSRPVSPSWWRRWTFRRWLACTASDRTRRCIYIDWPHEIQWRSASSFVQRKSST